MKKIVFLLLIAAGLETALWAGPGNPCGTFSIGTFSIHLTEGQQSASVSSRDALVEAIQAGIAFTGSSDCSGTFEIVNLKLRIATDKEDVNYDYDFDMIRQMQSMEDFMLTRYFIDAKTLYFSEIRVKNANGETIPIADVRFDIL